MADSLSATGLLVETILIMILVMTIAGALFVYYYRTRILDYMIISGTFILASIMYFSKYMVIIYTSLDPLPFLRAHDVSMSALDVLYMVYALRVRWIKPPKLAVVLGTLWFVFITYCTMNYEIIPNQVSSFVLFARDFPCSE